MWRILFRKERESYIIFKLLHAALTIGGLEENSNTTHAGDGAIHRMSLHKYHKHVLRTVSACKTTVFIKH